MDEGKITDLATAVGKTRPEVLEALNGVIPSERDIEPVARRLVHHFQQENLTAYPEDVLADDTELISSLLPSKTIEEVENTLKTVGYAKHRVSIAMRFLCGENVPKVDRKRANSPEPCEATETKLFKVADSSEPPPEMNGNSRIPKLVSTKKEGNCKQYQIDEPRPSGWLSKKMPTSTITRPPDDNLPSSSTGYTGPREFRPIQPNVVPFAAVPEVRPTPVPMNLSNSLTPFAINVPGGSQTIRNETPLRVPYVAPKLPESYPKTPMNRPWSSRPAFAGNIPGGTHMPLNHKPYVPNGNAWWPPPKEETTTRRYQVSSTATPAEMDRSVISLDHTQDDDDDEDFSEEDMEMDAHLEISGYEILNNMNMNGGNHPRADRVGDVHDLNAEVQRALMDSPNSTESGSTIFQTTVGDISDYEDDDDELIMPEPEELIRPADESIIPAPTSLIRPASLPTAKPADEKLVHKLLEMFPQALPSYIREICAGKLWSDNVFDQLVDIILNNEHYPRRPEREPSPEHEIDAQEQLNMLKSVLPDADPTYLERKLDELGGDNEAFGNFISEAIELKNYPTMKEYLRKQQLSAQQRQYTTEFDVKRFVELFPDPVSVFEDVQKKSPISDAIDKYLVKWFLRMKYPQLYANDINNIMSTHGSMASMIKALDNWASWKKTKTAVGPRPECQNVPLLQELAYFEHKIEIIKFIEQKKIQEENEKRDAKELGLLETCTCCFDDEIMPKDIFTCLGGCRFCKDCIRRSTEVAVGDGKTDFRCLAGECNEEFSLQVLQSVLPPKMFSKIAQKKALAEVKAAGIDELESCPFCDFANIPAPDDKLFRCLNPECMKESCRLCKEPSHVPLRCEEVEKDEDVKARVYIENKMTEALVRQCWKCSAKFIKEEGCNKMTCSCGAMMCYICRQPVKDYKHFNGQGGDRYDLCPLYSENFSVNEKNVLEAAQEARKEVDPGNLKHDPTADLEQHFAPQIKRSQKLREAIQNNARGHHQHHHHHLNHPGNGYNIQVLLPDIRFVPGQRLLQIEDRMQQYHENRMQQRVQQNYQAVIYQQQPLQHAPPMPPVQHQPPQHPARRPRNHNHVTFAVDPIQNHQQGYIAQPRYQPHPPQNPNNNQPRYEPRYH